MQRDEDFQAGARPDEPNGGDDALRRITTDEEAREEWIDEDLAQDPEYRQAQRDAGGDATTPMTGRIPVGEVPPIDDGPAVPGDLSDEIPSSARNAPGTVDDIPVSLGDNRPNYKPPLEPLSSGDEETDLWQMQQPLIDEDRETSVHLEGFTEEQARHIMESSGDDAEPQAQGYSATGFPFDAPHGGFPERREGGEESRSDRDSEKGPDERPGRSEDEDS